MIDSTAIFHNAQTIYHKWSIYQSEEKEKNRKKMKKDDFKGQEISSNFSSPEFFKNKLKRIAWFCPKGLNWVKKMKKQFVLKLPII